MRDDDDYDERRQRRVHLNVCVRARVKESTAVKVSRNGGGKLLFLVDIFAREPRLLFYNIYIYIYIRTRRGREVGTRGEALGSDQ